MLYHYEKMENNNNNNNNNNKNWYIIYIIENINIIYYQIDIWEVQV